MNADDLYEANIRVRIARDIDHTLNTLASIQGKLKWEIVRDALVEYVENHKREALV